MVSSCMYNIVLFDNQIEDDHLNFLGWLKKTKKCINNYD